MAARSSMLIFALIAGLGISSIASADDVVLPPLVPRGATQVRDVANLSQLLASELDFMREVDTVKALNKVPAGFGVGCLDDARCLKGIGTAQGGSHVLAGSLQVREQTVAIDLVYYSVKSGRFVRRQSFDLPNSPEEIANSMGAIAKEMVTGERPGDDAVAGDDLDLLDFDDDFEVDFNKEDFAEAQAAEAGRKREQAQAAARREAEDRARREAEARAQREADERARLEEQARARREAEAAARREAEERARREAAEAERRRAEAAEAERRRNEDRRRVEEQRMAEARRREEAARRERALREEEARRPDPVEPEEDEFDPSAISFGSAAIVVEGDGPVAIETETTTTPDYYEDEPDELVMPDDEPDDLRIADLDDDEPSPKPVREKPAREKRTKTPRQKSSGGGFDDTPTPVTIALRGGYSPYYKLGFVTVGGELAIAAGESGVHVIAGFQTYAVQRTIPEEFRPLAGATTEWNTIFPINAGVVYKVPVADGRVKPYAGADLVFARYYSDDSGGIGSVAFGARARGGVDIMIVRNVGLNADLALGGWGGGDWEIIESGVKNAGLLPQFSAGTVIAF